jgi:hypothetical protein
MCGKSLKKMGVLRSLKYTFDWKTLETLYISYIRSGLEYASSVWDNCTLNELNQLESIQTDATRIVTGLPKYCSLERLYSEIGSTSLHTRRRIKKLIMMYKIVNNLAPVYLTELLPPTVGQVQHHFLRNNYNIHNYRPRTATLANSYFPSTINLWNDLEVNIRLAVNIGQLQKYKVEQPPTWYLHGDRKANVLLCRLRNKCSIFFFRCNLIDSGACVCGHQSETASHFFFQCPNFIHQHEQLFNSLCDLGDTGNRITLDLLLCGSRVISLNENKLLIDYVTKCITVTKRFK